MDIERIDEPVLAAHQFAADITHSLDGRVSPWLMGGWCLRGASVAYAAAVILAVALSKKHVPFWILPFVALILLVVVTLLHF